MNKLKYKSEKEMQEELKKRISKYKEGNSKDGYIFKAEGKFVYKGIAYLIKVLRYYNHTNKFTTIGRERVSECHVVVEYPKETERIVELIPNEFSDEFLWHDTLHIWNDKQTEEEQIEECHKLAKQDIDDLLHGGISKRLEIKIKKLQDIKNKLKKEEK